MTKLAIIPARGGSKRILRKNIRSFLNKPIIVYSIEAALKSNLFDEVMVSTDDDEIASIARAHGAKVPFQRSAKNADDVAVLADVVEEVLLTYEKEGLSFESVCCILPTAPFVSATLLERSYEKLHTDNFDSIFPIMEFSFPIQRSLKKVDDKIHMVWEEHMNSRSQDLDTRYHDAGQFYWLKVSTFLNEKKLFMKNSGGIVISELEAQDIDSETDWKLAELKYKLMINEKNNTI
ncbi:pseudaminic acid cytidylyltransferase [Flavobacteriaceae bacterium S356]|uniref:Pseudaminic acid cytidylyltransferase n=1 Tax=Asprobacillus argus TaxID=3076534 RepID=A0ABU3LBZ9_9FLAO|nr:pseudaminic acid cytidylyltransferase [Flavobacteriaceae bacterium S356]